MDACSPCRVEPVGYGLDKEGVLNNFSDEMKCSGVLLLTMKVVKQAKVCPVNRVLAAFSFGSAGSLIELRFGVQLGRVEILLSVRGV